MNYLTLITLVSAICGIIGFFTSKIIKNRIILWSVIVFFLTFASGLAVQYNSELERIKDIHRQAHAIYNHYNPFDYRNRDFIQESLTFLEENKDRYPDAYKRATQIYLDMKESESLSTTADAAIEIRGIIKGISTLNSK